MRKLKSQTKLYEILDHTADVRLKAYGRTLKELFENAAKGMFEIIMGEPIHKARNIKEHRAIEIKKTKWDVTYEELLVDWLTELLYTFNKEEIYLARFKILKFSNTYIYADAGGNKINPTKSTPQTEIKAVTFHGLKIEEDVKGFTTTIVFDV